MRRTPTTHVPEGSALDHYLQAIARYPLLTREEEAVLAARIRGGDEESVDRLVLANLRFVVSVAKQYANQGVALEDLVNEGNLGLLKAARRFDERRGFKFISYAVWWIRQSILQALAHQSRIVRVPLNRVGVLYRVGRATQELEQELGRAPTFAEIAEKLGLEVSEVEQTAGIANSHVSLDSPGVDSDEGGLVETLVDPHPAEVDEALLEAELAEELERALAALSEREARIIRLYYGIRLDRRWTLEEIGGEFGLTRERIRQIKEQALAKLRVVAAERCLDDYLAG